MVVVLLNMCSTILVEREVLTVTQVMKCLEGCQNVGIHGIYGLDLVTTKEVVVQDQQDLLSILG